MYSILVGDSGATVCDLVGRTHVLPAAAGLQLDNDGMQGDSALLRSCSLAVGVQINSCPPPAPFNNHTGKLSFLLWVVGLPVLLT